MIGDHNDDRIYGLGGNDKLNGLKGNDFLDGGAGDDELIGGEGSDLLVGGKDKDILIGEAGNDILKGGEGDDTYKFTGNFGRDIIIDNEGSNTLDINGAIGELTQTSKDSLIYNNASNTVEVILIEEGGKKSLLINSLSNSGSSITIDNWVSGQFGITLKEFENEESPSLHIINGNANANQLFPYFEENQHYSASEIHGGAGGDFIHGSSEDDKLYGGDGDDWITAGNNRGKFSSLDPTKIMIPAGGGGKDFIDGGDGDDVISGIAEGSTWLGGDGNDMLLGGSVFHMFRFNGPSVDGTSDDVRASIAWQDFSQHFKKGFKADKKTVGTINEHGYSAWAGIEPGTYTGVSAHGNGWQYKIEVTNSTPLYDPAAINAGVSHYSYNSDNFNASFNMRIYYSHPSRNDGQFSLSNGLYFEFGLLPKALKDGITLESVANYKHLNLHGGKDDDLLLGWYARDELQGGEGNDVIYADKGNDLVDGGSGNDTLAGGWGNDTLIGGDGNDLMLGDSTDSSEVGSDDIMYGGKGNDSLHGNQGNDFLYGGDGDDQLIGNTGNDYLYGGEGIDTILGGTGADTIVGALGDTILNGDEDDDLYIIDTSIATGAEVHSFANTENNNLAFTAANSPSSDSPTSSVTSINDSHGKDTISFLGLNNLNDMSATAQGNDLVLRYRGRSIFIKDGLNGAIDYMSTGDSIEAVSVAGSGSSGATAIENFLLENLETAITRVGGEGAPLVGGLLDDSLTAHAQGSIITGGKGNDSLYGGQGNDVYVIRSGDGNDTIYESGGINSIRFTEGILPEQLTLRRVGNNLLIIVSEDQRIIINGIFNETTGDVIADKAIQRIEFNNGQSWDFARILEESAKGVNLIGTEFADTLIGYGSGDTITGGKGNDKLYGDKGDDHYRFAAGDGADLIDDVSGTDHLHFAAGVTESQVSLRRDTSNNLIIRINNTDSITVLNAFNTQGELTAHAIEQIHFDNNNVWDVQRINTELALNKPYSFTGTTSNDVLTGDNAIQVLNGGKGDDQLQGGNANDTYQYALGDGKDRIVDMNGTDRLELLAGINESDVIARRNGDDLVLTLKDGGSVTVQNTFAAKAANVVDPVITALIDQLQSHWLSQAEQLIEEHYGLIAGGDLTLEFERDVAGGEAAHVEATYTSPEATGTNLKLVIDLNDFSDLPNGNSPWYYDRVIAHEMVHAIMARNMNASELPSWFNEGTAEFIHGADERVKGDADILALESNFSVLFKTTPGSPSHSAAYSVSYIAVKLLDKEIRDNGGLGIKDVFNHLKTGKTLDQSLAAVSAAYPSLSGLWNSKASFESHFLVVGFAQYPSLLNLENQDTGSIAGSDYGHSPKSEAAIMPEGISGPSKNFNVIVPAEYIPTPEIRGALESIRFSNGNEWNQARVLQEVLKSTNGNDIIHAFDTNDTLTGSKGNDQLFGCGGNDVYRYSLGDGSDVITDSAGTDQIEFSAEILAADVKLRRDAQNNLIITVKDGSIITVKNAFDTSGNFTTGSIESIKFLGGITWDAAKIMEEVNKPSEPVINIVNGTASSETLMGSSGDDVVIGGKGNDQLNGYAGNDIYRYSSGDGNDIIIDSAGTDQIEFSAAVLVSDVKLKRDVQNDLVVTLKDNSTITVKNAFDSWGNLTGNSIESIKFLSGAIWDAAKIREDANKPGANLVNGTIDSETLIGTTGIDILTGGKGNDLLQGKSGNDTYVYNLGDGNDTIVDDSGVDVINFGQNIFSDQVIFSRWGWYGVKIDLQDGSSIIINNMFNSIDVGAGAVEGVRFANDEFWDLSRIKAEILKRESSDGNDVFDGFGGDDVLEGKGGYDRIYGREGNDRYIFKRGDGVDIINDTSGNDTLVFGEGITPEDIIVHQASGNLYFIINNGEMVQIMGSLIDGAPDESKFIEKVDFSNGVVWDQVIIKQKIAETKINPDVLFGRNIWDDLYSGSAYLIHGLDGDDEIRGGRNTNFIMGGGGLNFLQGYGATYLITEQPSLNFIENFRTDQDRILFAEGIKPKDVKVKIVEARIEAGLEDGRLMGYTLGSENGRWNLELTTGEVSIYLDSLFTDGAYIGAKVYSPERAMGTVEFFDGTRWTIDDLLVLALNTSANNDWINGTGYNDKISGKEGHDSIYSYSGQDLLEGGVGDDRLVGGDDEDTLIGGKGNDELYGDSGEFSNRNNANDTYIFNVGDGNDTITDLFGFDIIEFGVGIQKEDVVITAIDEDLVVSFLNLADSITIISGAIPEYKFYVGGKIENFKFSNGDILNFDLKDTPIFLEGDNRYNFLFGGNKNDTIIGGLGGDEISGGDGDDEYRYNLGDGFDKIIETGGNDKIVFGEAITPDITKIIRHDGTFTVYVDGEQALSFRDSWSDVGSIDSIFFANGEIWNVSQMISKSLIATSQSDSLYGSDFNDLINGYEERDFIKAGMGNDTIIGGLGHDSLEGGLGDDIYQIGSGHGYDQIFDEGGIDTIEFGVGILPSDISVQVVSSNLEIKIKNGETIVLYYVFDNDPTGGATRKINTENLIEKFTFSNGESLLLSQFLQKLSVGTNLRDTIYGSDINDLMDGQESSDGIYAGGGNDTLIGGAGNDGLYGERGDDILYGGDGDDFLVDFYGSNIYVGGKGNDRISLSNGDSVFGRESAGPSIMRFSLGDGVDTIDWAVPGQMVIELGEGISPEMLAFKSYNDGLVDLLIPGTTDQINQLSDRREYSIKFFDGTYWSPSQLSVAVNKSKAFLSTSKQTLSGTVRPNSKVFISALNQNNTITNYPVIHSDSSGYYEINFEERLYTHQIEIFYEDVVGNKLPLTVFDAVDSRTPPAPTAEIDASGYLIEGFTSPGAIVSLLNYYASVASDPITGFYSIVLPDNFVNGEDIKVVASFNHSSYSLPVVIRAPDTTAPMQASGILDHVGSRIEGIAEKGAEVTLIDNVGNTLGIATASASDGTYAIKFQRPVANGELIEIITRDAVGNSSSGFIRAPDLIAPASLYASINTNRKTINGYTEPGAKIIVRSLTGSFLGEVVASGENGAFELTLSTALAVSDIVNLRVIDVAGNVSEIIQLKAPAINSPIQPSAAFDVLGKTISGVGGEGGVLILKDQNNHEVSRTVIQAGVSFSIELEKSCIKREVFNVTLLNANGDISFIAPDRTPPKIPSAILDDYNYDIEGYAEPGSTVDIVDKDGDIIATVNADLKTGRFAEVLYGKVAEGEDIFVRSADGAGNISSLKLTVYDLTAPSLSGHFDEQGRVISGITEPGALVYIKNSSDYAIANGNGSYSIELSEPIISGESFEVHVKDKSNNISSIYVDSPDLTQPMPPTAQFDSAGKVITGETQSTSAGGSQVIVMDSTNTRVLGSVVLGAYSGSFKITLATALKNNEVVNITVKDIAGNTSYATSINAPDKTAPIIQSVKFNETGKIIIGTTEPGGIVVVKDQSGQELKAAIADLTSGNFSITLDSAFINKETVNVTVKDAAGNVSTVKPIIAPDLIVPVVPTASIDAAGKVITGDGEKGSTIIVRSVNGEELKTATVNASTGKYTLTLTTAMINKETLLVFSKDTAGNISAPTSVVAPDKTPPAIPSAEFDATGQIITGYTEAGSTVTVRNSSNVVLKTVAADAVSGAYSVTLDAAFINKQTVSITATDIAGNISGKKSIIAPDLTPPGIPTAAIDATGKIITGKAEKGSTVIVKDANGVELKSVVLDAATDAYTLTLDVAKINKETLLITAKDPAGNISTPKSILAPDKTPPAAPSAVLDATRKIITGTAEISSKIEVKNAAGTVLKSVTANATNGSYSITLTTALTIGEKVTITAKDAASNISAPTVLTAAAQAVSAIFAEPVPAYLLVESLFGEVVDIKVSRTPTGVSDYHQQNGALIQAMASFAVVDGVDTKRSIHYFEERPAILAPAM